MYSCVREVFIHPTEKMYSKNTIANGRRSAQVVFGLDGIRIVACVLKQKIFLISNAGKSTKSNVYEHFSDTIVLYTLVNSHVKDAQFPSRF
jgi:hypothetical protein